MRLVVLINIEHISNLPERSATFVVGAGQERVKKNFNAIEHLLYLSAAQELRNFDLAEYSFCHNAAH